VNSYKKGHNTRCLHEERRVHFGKYRGYLYTELPINYLIWLSNNAFNSTSNRRKWAVDELSRRGFSARGLKINQENNARTY